MLYITLAYTSFFITNRTTQEKNDTEDNTVAIKAFFNKIYIT